MTQEERFKATIDVASYGQRVHRTGWVGFDLDATLAVYNGWIEGKIGDMIPSCKALLEYVLKSGIEARIMTARACGIDAEEQTKLIQDWLEENGLPRLQVTCSKDYEMICLVDDRAFAIEKNTGKLI